jgi:hypothetical protein
MNEADYGMTAAAMSQTKSDDGLYVEFGMFPIQNKVKTVEEGRPIFDEVPFVKIMIPGDKDNIVHRKVKATDKQRWPRQWQAFENQQEQPLEGTPLVEWPGISRSQCEELAHFGIKTVEQLAQMADSNTQKFMGLVGLKHRAVEYLEASKSAAPFQQLQAENDHLRNEIEAMKDQIAQLAKPKRATRKPAEE